jgi:hypothetical protein
MTDENAKNDDTTENATGSFLEGLYDDPPAVGDDADAATMSSPSFERRLKLPHDHFH